MIGGGSVCHDGGDYRACPGRLTNPGATGRACRCCGWKPAPARVVG
ncbi:hypothetical protein AX27061_2364 [Achromobacter xylosoxidans NBRC 15126 = ATCC 27061]|nr:hypothetical protein AX27061_2364 [Achromobacter xylosoxidans NBRC 15126 = ATCC 27061]